MTQQNRLALSRRALMKRGAAATGALVIGSALTSGTAAADIGDGRVLDFHLNNVGYDVDKGEKTPKHVHDASPYKHHGEWNTASDTNPVVKDGAVGNAYQFITSSGSDYDYIEVPDTLDLDITQSLTLAAWVKASNQDDFARLISREQSGVGNRQYNLGFDSSGNYPRSVVDTSAGAFSVVGTTSITDNNWYHVAMTFEADGELRMYVDGGMPEASVSVSGSLVSKSADVTVGVASHLPEKDSFDGLMDEVRVYNRALSAADIQELVDMRDTSV